MEILGKILGSPARVKIMRIFMHNPKVGFSNQDVAKRCRVTADIARREIKLLESIDFIKKYSKGWFFDPEFKYAAEVAGLLIDSDTVNKETITNNLKRTGRVKLLVVSGIFIKDKNSRVDLLIVGDSLKKGKIDEEMKKLEAEIGTELAYAVFTTKDFIYRLNMYDKLVRDILDFPHEILLQHKELSTQALKKA